MLLNFSTYERRFKNGVDILRGISPFQVGGRATTRENEPRGGG